MGRELQSYRVKVRVGARLSQEYYSKLWSMTPLPVPEYIITPGAIVRSSRSGGKRRETYGRKKDGVPFSNRKDRPVKSPKII